MSPDGVEREAISHRTAGTTPWPDTGPPSDGAALATGPPPAARLSDPSDPTVQSLPVSDVFAALDGSPRGLTHGEATARQTRYGRNELPRVRQAHLWQRLIAQFTDLFAVVLLVSSAITFLAYGLERPRDPATIQLAVAIFAVVLLNAGIGFAQEYSAERTAESLQAMVPHTCRVLRDGEPGELPARDLVPGDVVLLEAGDAVLADCSLVEAHEVAVNNAALTGESDSVARVAEQVPVGPPLEARNCVFMGTDVVGGTGKAVVSATGTATEFGRIFRLTAAAPRQRTPLQHQVAAMARRVAGVALTTGAVLFAVRVPSGQPFVNTFVFSRGNGRTRAGRASGDALRVTGHRCTPHGPPHALVKQLLAVEALGSTSVVCTDKTGTLTQAEMTVVQVWANGVSHAVAGVGYRPVGEIVDAGCVRNLLRTAALCSNARLVPPTGRDGWRVLGDTTEGALLVAAMKAGLDPAQEETGSPRVTEYPFDSVRKLMSTVHRAADGTYIACVKGAPLELLARCKTIDREGTRKPFTEASRAEVVTAADAMAAQGLRVLAVAGSADLLTSPGAWRRRVGADPAGTRRDVRPAQARGAGSGGRVPHGRRSALSW
ncbi:cation-translocating P-type ATPase [Streptomyces kaempferi]